MNTNITQLYVACPGCAAYPVPQCLLVLNVDIVLHVPCAYTWKGVLLSRAYTTCMQVLPNYILLHV